VYQFNVRTINLSLRYTLKCIRKGQAQPYHLTDDVSQLYSRMTKETRNQPTEARGGLRWMANVLRIAVSIVHSSRLYAYH